MSSAETGKLALVLSDTSASSSTVTVNLTNSSSPLTTVTPFTTSATQNQAQGSPISVTNGTFTITVPSHTVITVVG